MDQTLNLSIGGSERHPANPDMAKARSTVFFGSLPDTVFESLFRQSHILRFESGQVLFHQGEPADALYAVLDGLIKLSVGSRDGDEVVVEIFQAGTSFAETLAFKEVPYPVTATALLNSRVLAVPKRAVQSILNRDPATVSAILAATYTHLHKLIRQIEQLKSSSGQQRVAQYILALAEAGSDCPEFPLPCKKQELASLLGIKPETLSRIFRRLESCGVSVDGNQVRLHDLDLLRAFVRIA